MKMKKSRRGGGGGGIREGQGGCGQRIEVFVKIKKKYIIFLGGRVGGGGVRVGGQVVGSGWM